MPDAPDKTQPPATEKPKFGTLEGKILISDPDWWKPMSDAEVDAFLGGCE